ncbi:tRNA-binding protein [Dyella nitratireducens]|uniref:tRNA-binding protein n=1 Tax=Dyella nitratireducens TaxID=1849580 RepID=A0ABQ1G2S8_9GAMM|nr:tRNA-binding protein [Dyella nitratireducens]GGA36295.1 tRNA-binding protein [Dyella nitratireducens]GLQ40194.1 tRNA-binding protein [Dyella nitratireducens]
MNVQTVSAEEISWADFEKVLIVAGTITRVEAFPEARKPAWKVWADFGPYGERKTSAQIAALYTPETLVGRQIVGVINFPEKQIGPFRSQFLLTGFPTEQGVVITSIERPVPNGTRLA